jgi:ribosomal protein L16 Arg81 hydroxylase
VDKGIDEYVMRLIELDSRALELKKKREAEIHELETKFREESSSLKEALRDASETGRRMHNKIEEEAKKQVKELEAATTEKLAALEEVFNKLKDDAAKDIWEQMLRLER